MERPKAISRLKMPSTFANKSFAAPNNGQTATQTKTVLEEMTNTDRKPAPGVSASLAARRARRSKSFCVTTSNKPPLISKLKASVSNINVARLKNGVQTSKAATGITSRNVNVTNRVNVPRTTLKRPAVETKPATTTSSSAPTAPKLSKFDYKGRFNQLEEKHKTLVVQFKDAKAQLDTLQNENEIFNSQTQEATNQQTKLQEKLKTTTEENAKLKVSNEQLRHELTQVQDDFSHCQSERDKLLKDFEQVTNDRSKLLLDFIDLQTSCERKDNENSHLKQQLHEIQNSLEDYKAILRQHEENRRVMHNQIQDLKGNIRVFCRVRPMNPSEEDKLPCAMTFVDESSLELRKSKESISSIRGKPTDCKFEFNFDRVFSEKCSQAEVFEDLAQLVQSTLDGYNVCVFAYGQTGSGKTFTMLGNDDNLGMIPRSIDLLFCRIKELEKSGWLYEVQVSFLEIYNESIKDLLNPDSKKLHDILFNDGKGSVVTNLRIETVKTSAQLKKFLGLANRNRATAATDFNLHSSRSHAVTRITVRGFFEQNEFYGSLNLVDLAGSESAKTSDRMTETKSINKSLSTLGTVMLSLHNKDAHIPYRNSKLTYLLQSSLGGNSKTLMFVNISPLEECYGETVNSLRFAAKVKEVKTGSKRNRAHCKSTSTAT